MTSTDDIIAELRQIVAEQAKRIAELELQLAKALKNSSNSLKSPSSDIVKPPGKKTDRRKKSKRGGPEKGTHIGREQLQPIFDPLFPVIVVLPRDRITRETAFR